MIELQKMKADYDRDGFVLIPAIFSHGEIECWGAEADRLWSLPEASEAGAFRVDSRATAEGTMVPERLDPVTDISPLFSDLAADERILSVVSFLLGDKPVLFKDKLIVKPPGVAGYPLHQDFAYIEFFGFDGSQQLAVCLAIDKTEPASGPIEFFPNYHHQRLPSPPDRPGETDERCLEMDSGKIVIMEPGDMVIFSSLCPHRSAANFSPSTRRLLFFTYNTHSSGDFYQTYYRMGKP